MKEKIIVALDVDTRAAALALVEQLTGQVGAFKIGMQLFNAAGPAIVTEVAQRGGRVFLDLKFHDIPNTVEKAARVVTSLGAFMFNVHAAGGQAMMRKAAAAVREEAQRLGIPKPLLIGVTVLTSMGQEELQGELGVDRTVAEQVKALALLAKEAGLDGVVASPLEIQLIREACGADFVIVTPGIRPAASSTDDQKRIMTPGQAVRAGCDYMVIGRPITQAPDPVAAAQAIVTEMEEMK